MQTKYPQNMKEAVISSVPNATTMVIGMMTLNLYIYDALTWYNFMWAFPKIWITAFVLDFFIVGPLVVRFVMRRGIQNFMPFIRVGAMAGILTFLAPLIETGRLISLSWYLIALPRNYVAALALQVFVALPFGLYVLGRFRHIKK